MKFNVTDIEFDFDDDYAEESKLTFDEEIAIRDLALGVWEADNDDDLLDEMKQISTRIDNVYKALISKIKKNQTKQPTMEWD